MRSQFTTGSLLSAWAHAQPEQTAVIDAKSGRHLSYRDLDEASANLGRFLHTQGVGPHDIVGYLTTDSLLVVSLLFAVGKLGAVWCPLNPNASPADWMRQLGHAGAAAIVHDDALTAQLAPWINTLTGVRAWIPRQATLDLDQDPKPFPDQAVDADVAGVLYTSGTTGVPKGARHTHGSLWGWNYSLLASAGMHRDDCLINPYPLFHMGGVGFTLAAIQAGATVVLITPFDAAQFADSVTGYGGTITLMVPTMVQSVLDLPQARREAFDQGNLRQLITTSAPLLTETRRDMSRAWPALKISVLYSATEAVFSLLRDERPEASLCVGKPAFGMELTVLQGSAACPPGSAGTIYGRGISVFAGYHRAPDQFSAHPDDWFTCGDVGYLDPDGYLYLIDREKDLINSGGEKLSSLEIENVLREHPWVKEVGVVGIPDRYWGERVHAVVVAHDGRLTREILLAFAAERLPRYKLPKSLALVSELPKTDTGKILKRALRETETSHH